MDFDAENEEKVHSIRKTLMSVVKETRIISMGEKNQPDPGIVPWFPRKIADLDSFVDKVLAYGAVNKQQFNKI